MEFRGVLFDLDDTLYDQQKPFSETLEKVFPWALQLPVGELYKKSRYYSDVLWQEYTLGTMTLEQIRLERIIRALKDFGYTISQSQADRFQKTYVKALKSISLFSDALNLLSYLKQRQYSLGIITNGPVNHQLNKVRQLKLNNYIPSEKIFISDSLGIAKPNPKVFMVVSEILKLPPNQLVYVGDSWRNDIVASTQANWNSIWFNHRNRIPDTKDSLLAEVSKLITITEIL
jgi:HAD superfamily hydrolase (TIGR01549 family)